MSYPTWEHGDIGMGVLGIGATLFTALQRGGEWAQDALAGNYGVRGTKVGLHLSRFSRLQELTRYSYLTTPTALVSNSWYGFRAFDRLISGEGNQSERVEDWLTLGGSAFTVMNLVAIGVFQNSPLLREITLSAGAAFDAVGLLIGIFFGRSWEEGLLQGAMLAFFNASPREWRRLDGVRAIRQQKRFVEAHQLKASLDVRNGVPTHRVQLGDGSYYMDGHKLAGINSGRTVRLIESKRYLEFNDAYLTSCPPGKDALMVKGRLFEYDGHGQFSDDFGYSLKSVGTKNGLRFYPEIQSPYPDDLHLQQSLDLTYKGERRPFVRLPEDEDLFLSEMPGSNRRDDLLVRYDQESGTFGLAEGVYFRPQAEDHFFYNGKRYRTLLQRTSEGIRHYLGEMKGNSDVRVAVRRPDTGKASAVTAGIRIDPKAKVSDRWKAFTASGVTYDTQYQDGKVVYGLRRGGQKGLPEDWFVGRIKEGGFGPESDSLIPLTPSMMVEEFQRKEAQWLSSLQGRKQKRFENLPRASTLCINEAETERLMYDFGNGHKRLPMVRYQVLVTGRHRIELLLPPEEDRVYSLGDWLRMLKIFPSNSLYGTKTLVVAPAGFEIKQRRDGRRIAGDFNARKERCRIVDGEPGVFATLVHEVLGHGTEKLNVGIERMIVLAMKLDSHSVGSYGATATVEHYSDSAPLRMMRPDLRRPHFYKFRLIDMVANINPRDVDVRGVTFIHRA